MSELRNLRSKVETYRKMVQNTKSYREIWQKSLKADIVKMLQTYCTDVGLKFSVEIQDQFIGMESIALDLGKSESGIYESLPDGGRRTSVKLNGTLIYQQLFNGKIAVWISYPFIEGEDKPNPPKRVGIYRPEELKPPFIVRHLEAFLQELINWEDFDDDVPQTIGFTKPPIIDTGNNTK